MHKRLGFILVLFALVFGGAEIALRFVMPDLDEIISPLIYQRNSGQAYTAGSIPDSRIYVSGRRRITVDRARGVRILVLGASAAYGEMFSAFASFPGWTQRYLRRTAPDTPIEVLNLAHGGMGSRQVKEMVFRAVSHDRPDLIVVYSGNNEFHELRALKARSDRYDPKAELLRRRLSKLYLYRALRDLVRPTEDILAPPEGEEWLPIGRLDVVIDDADRELGTLLYAEHLQDIVLVAQAHGVPVLLTTVATNLRDHVDNGTPGVLSPEGEARLNALSSAVDKESPGAIGAMAEQARPLLQTEGAQHQLGHILLKAGLESEAFTAFETAEALALRPMKGSPTLRSAVRRAATTFATPMCDLAMSLAQDSPNGVPGNDVFLDHCHPNAVGHQRLGRALARCIVGQGLLNVPGTPAEQRIALDAAIRDLDATSPDPFRLDHYTEHRWIPGNPTPEPVDPTTALGRTTQGHRSFVEGRFNEALSAYEEARSLGAPQSAVHLAIGLTQLYRHQLPAAQRALKKAHEANPDDIDLRQIHAMIAR